MQRVDTQKTRELSTQGTAHDALTATRTTNEFKSNWAPAMDGKVPPPPPPPAELAQFPEHATPDRFKLQRNVARARQVKANDRLREKALDAQGGVPVFEPGDVVRLKLNHPGVNRSSLARTYEIVMVVEEVRKLEEPPLPAFRQYKVISSRGVVKELFKPIENLHTYPVARDFPFATLADAQGTVGNLTITWHDLAMADTLESFRCKCRATKGHGTKCGDSCPCRKAGRPCSSLCHRGGTCCNWTLPEVNEIENRNVTA